MQRVAWGRNGRFMLDSQRLRRYPVAIMELFRDALSEWSRDKASMLAAGLAYHTLFSLAPIVILLVAIGSRLLQNINVQEKLFDYVNSYAGEDIANFVQSILVSSDSLPSGSSNLIVTIIGFFVIFWGASGVFNQLKRALNIIWAVEPKPRLGWHGGLYYLQTRLLAVIMVLAIGFLLSLSLFLHAIIGNLNHVLEQYNPELSAILNNSTTSFVIFGITVMAFTIIYKALPDAKLSWKDVWFGGVVTAVLFALGNFGLSKYIEVSNIGSAYGAAGSLIILLVWMYYSAQIFFYGAEFTKVYANKYGSKVIPANGAIAVRRELVYDEEALTSINPVTLPISFYETEEKRPFDGNQKSKLAGFGLMGLAIGLFLGYFGGKD
jgi:membrane protein